MPRHTEICCKNQLKKYWKNIFFSTVKNSGLADTGQQFYTAVYIDWDGNGTWDQNGNTYTDPLGVNATEDESWPNISSVNPPGDHFFKVCADTLNIIEEWYENNNCTNPRAF